MLWAPCGLANALLTARGHAREQLQVNLIYGALLATAVGAGASVSLAAAAVLLQAAVLARTVLTLRVLRRQLGFGTRRLLRALAPSAALALAAGVLAAATAWGGRELAAPALLTLLAAAAVLAAATLALAVRAGHPLGLEVQTQVARRRRGGGAA
ncbi:MAG: hypothetical protein IPK42_06995 [Betaproteobacteria bacterium]|nr:hypothetical protein [Betaproteobacteria bacterium]